MGYEVMMLIGKRTLREEPIFELKPNGGYVMKDGKPVETGRWQQWFKVMAVIDLAKIGRFPLKFTKKPQDSDIELFWCAPTGGDRYVRKDLYNEVPILYDIKTVYDALVKAMDEDRDDYRRFKWAKALLDSMVNDPEGLEVIFFGH